MSSDSLTIEYRYRFVPFGTKFSFAGGMRASAADGGSDQLFENEIAADVGGICLGHHGESLPVIDHHFFRESGQYPSAAAAVLHHAVRVRALRESIQGKSGVHEGVPATVWLVSHVYPDFDALSSLYLVRQLFDGALEADGWEAYGIRADGWYATRGEIDWMRPRFREIPADRRWAILLAAEASRTDNCRNSRCPRERRLASVLYAAMERGRGYTDERDGGLEFFDEVRRLLIEGAATGLDPYSDSVLEDSRVFSAELSLLDREVAAYEGDLRRAHRLIVYLPEATVPFSQWYPDLATTPMLDAEGKVHPKQSDAALHGRRAVDGLFLRDPESLLFRNWARNDTENTSLKAGFTFTALVYSQGRPSGVVNTGDYYFSIDPEHAGRMHLYPVWLQLQQAETETLALPEHQSLRQHLQKAESEANQTGGTRVRPGFEGRSGVATGSTTLGFDDPWFDGQNYGCTIIPTPNRGTLLGPAGHRSDLSDDPVARIVLDELTESVFGERIILQEFPGSAADSHLSTPRVISTLKRIPPVSMTGYRFVSVELDPDINLGWTELVLQIAVRLWRCLDDNRSGTPDGFADRNVFRGDDWTGVWNERGIVVAYRPCAAARAEGLQLLFEKVCQLAHSMHRLIADAGQSEKSGDISSQLVRSEKMLLELALRNHDMTLPENMMVRQFFEASRLDQSLAMVRDIHGSAADRLEAERMRELAESQNRTTARMNDGVATLVSLQQKLEYVEVGIVLVYAAELTHILGESFEFAHFYTGIGVLICPLFAAVAAWCWLIAGNDHHRPDSGQPGQRRSTIAIATLLASIAVITTFVVSGLMFSSLRLPHVSGSHAEEPH